MVKEGVCEVIAVDLEEKSKERWRNILEQQKARDIRELEAELRSIDQKLAEIGNAFAGAQAALDSAKSGLHDIYVGMGKNEADYEKQCGNRHELWPS